MKKIYSETKDLKYKDAFIRTYESNVEQNDLIWIKNESTTIIEPLYNKNWKIQFENMFPVLINEKIVIKKNEKYRFLKGDGILKIRIY